MAAVVGRARVGDRAAFAELYGAYADGIHDFCRSLLRERHDAADAMHDTFVLAAQRLEQLRDPERIKPWLYAIARHVCFRKLEQRKRATPSDIAADVIVLEDEHELDRQLAASSAAELVWAAAAGLNDRDRAIIDLNARHGLEGPDLAAAIGVTQSNPYSLLHRARTQLERALRLLVLAREGRSECSELGAILERWNGKMTPLLRKRIGRHADSCAFCGPTTARVNPLAMLAAAPVIKISKADALDANHVLDIASRRPERTERWQHDGFPPPIDTTPRRRRRKLFFVLFGAGVLSIVTGVTITTAANSGHSTRGPGAPVVRHGQRAPSRSKPKPIKNQVTLVPPVSLAAPPASLPVASPSTAALAAPPPTPAPTTIPTTPTTHVTAPPTTKPPVMTTTTIPST
ncbi:MAG TPA: sigma-70 family RNA polymerase sigma factor [Acidimicrobiia bacterium]|nr:sigma-70 family RNA polymerase sigma factor [Acidimicrobiia bacterium]